MKNNRTRLFCSIISSILLLSSCSNDSKKQLYTVTPKEKDATVILKNNSYNEGDTVEFGISCSKDHYMLVVTDGGNLEVQYTALGDNKYSFSMPACNLFINATGYDDPKPTTYNVNLIKDDEINATISKTSACLNDVINISVDYSKEYSLKIDKVGGGSISYTGSHPNYSFTMPEAEVNVTLRKIVPITYEISTQVDEGISVTLDKTSYCEGETVNFGVLCSSENYKIEIRDAGGSAIQYTSLGSNNYSFIMPASNLCIKVSKNDYPLIKKLTYEERYQEIWNNRTVFNEMVMLYTHSDGTTYGELLYTPTSIIEVKDYLMTKIFTNDIDFIVQGKKIIIKDVGTTSMPYLTLEQYNAVPTSLVGTDIGTYASSKSPSGFVLYTEYPHIVKKTIMVTYEHEDSWTGHEMYKQGNLLPNTLSKLAEKTDFNLAIYGDSNATGAVTSGYWKEDYEKTHPGASTLFHENYDFQDGFPIGFKTAIEKIYGVNCNLYNPSEGGQVSGWMNQFPTSGSKNLWTGAEYDPSKTRLENWLIDCVPDLVVFVWGNNDITSGVSAETYLNNISIAIDKIKVANPNAEFIISLPKRSNPLSIQDDTTKSQQYLNIVKKYIKDANGGVAFHDMTTLTSDLLLSKDAYSLFGNGINHSNDFLARQWVSMFMNVLTIPEVGKEWNYDTDNTIKKDEKDYAKNWDNVVSDVSLGEKENIEGGVKLTSLSTWGEGFARKEKVYLDGLSFDFRSDNMRYGGSVSYGGSDSYLLSTVIGFFFSKEVGTWTGANAYPFGGFAFNLLDIFGQERVYVGVDNDYNKSTILYTDPACNELFTSNGTNQMIFNRIGNTDGTDRAGVSVKFKKVSDSVYSIKIGALLGAYMWENNPNYNANDVSCTYYIKAESFANILNEDGSTYLNVFGYGPEYQGKGYGDNMYATVTHLSSTEPAPIPLGEEEAHYISGSGTAVRFYYNPVVESSTPMAIERGKAPDNWTTIDIAHRQFGVDLNGSYCEITGIGMEYIVAQSGLGTYDIRLLCSNGSCCWRLVIE